MSTATSTTLAATVLIPTITGRAAVLPLSVGSALRQSVRDIEIFIMGDGVTDAPTRDVIARLCREDSRVRFFDHAKGARRGEPHRHAALSGEARGRIVCYLCDRDLMLPEHIATMDALLRERDLAHTLIFDVLPDGEFRFEKEFDLARTADRQEILRGWSRRLGLPLSFAGHTLAFYRTLPHGWRVTPEGQHTDQYMWEQMLAQPTCRAGSGREPSVLFFRKADRSSWSVEQRRTELESWDTRIAEAEERVLVVGRVRREARRAQRRRVARRALAPLARVLRRIGLRVPIERWLGRS